MTTKLSVNVNKIAWLRNARDEGEPSVTRFCELILRAGAAGITVHPRPDERHIRAADVPAIARVLEGWPGREYNIEGNPFMNLLGHVEASRPDQATFVPDGEGQLTSDHGFDLARDGARVEPLIARARRAGARVSLFMDPVPGNMRLAREVGADRVELYTAGWAAAFGTAAEAGMLARYAESAQAAREAGLGVNAGHDLSLANLERLLTACRVIDEVSIGHALVGEALELGMAQTVGLYNGVCLRAADLIAAGGA